MKKLALAPVALALLAACVTEDKVAPAPAPVVVAPQPQPPAPVVTAPSSAAGTVVVPATPPTALRTGVGFVASIASAPANAAVGGTAANPTKRVGVRMADNTIQYLDTAASGLKVGDRVEITPEGNLRRPAP